MELWTRYFQKRKQPKIRLFCLPFAGGNAEFYLPWREMLNEIIEVCPLQLPARSYRAKEPLPKDLDAILEAIVQIITNHSDVPYALFGHSMGGFIAHEATLLLEKEGRPPKHLFISGRAAPSAEKFTRPYHSYTDAECISSIQQFGGLPEDLAQSEEYISWILPQLRQDMKLCWDYAQSLKSGMLEKVVKTDMTIFGGNNDHDVPLETLDHWENFTQGKITYFSYDEGHFFIKKFMRDVCEKVETTLTPSL